MKTAKSFPCWITALTLCSALLPAQAQWNQNSDVGPYIYTDPANWVGGVINNVFTNPAPISGLTLTFTNDFILTNGVLMNFSGNSNVIFQSDSATPRTLHISLGHFLRTNQSGGTITIGTTNNPLILDLYNSTRTIGGVGSGSLATGDATMNVYAKITDLAGGTNGVNLGLGRVYTYLLNNSNDFVGPVSFAGLRGGAFTSIKNIGAGPSAMGAPTDTTNGTVTVVDNTSLGSVSYLGTGDTTDRPFVWNLTGSTYSFMNQGSGKVTFTGPWTLPYAANRTNIFTINASNHIELDGWLNGSGPAMTNLVFKGYLNTNRIIVTCPTNIFRALELTNVVLAFNNISNAGLTCALGTNGTIVHRGNAGTSNSGNPSGDGASLQYFGPTATSDRVIAFSGLGYNWGVDNGSTNTALIWTSDFVGASAGTGLLPRYLHLNVYSSSTNEFQGVVPDVAPGLATTVVVGTPVGPQYTGTSLFNGGLVRLLNPSNSFSGGIQIKYARTVQVTTLADSGTPCSIGTGTTPPVAGQTALIFGSTDSGRVPNTLAYTGTNDAACNRSITVLGSGTSGGCVILNNSPNNSSLHFSDPGTWTLGPTMTNTCFVTLGGTAVATNILDAAIPNTPGNLSLTVNGSTWKLTGIHSYAGATAVTNSTLLLEGSIGPAADVTVQKNALLGGNGTINANVTVKTNGTLSPGDSIGTLTVTGNLTNNGSLLMEIKATDGTSDLITGISTLAYGGTLVVTNVDGTLTNGATFTLFSATTYSGAFASINPATPGPGQVWDLSDLTNNGSLKVAAGASVPPQIGAISVSGSAVVISGTNNTGTGGGTFYVRASTNVTLPIASWTWVSTNTFDANGNFNVTNAMSPGAAQEFFRVQLP